MEVSSVSGYNVNAMMKSAMEAALDARKGKDAKLKEEKKKAEEEKKKKKEEEKKKAEEEKKMKKMMSIAPPPNAAAKREGPVPIAAKPKFSSPP